MARIEALINRQGEDLIALQDREAALFLAAYDDARRYLADLLDQAIKNNGSESFTAQKIRIYMIQVERGSVYLRNRLTDRFGQAEVKNQNAALENLLEVIKKAESKFTDVGGAIEVKALKKLTAQRGLLLHEHSIQRYGLQVVESCQQQLVRGALSGLSYRQTRDLLVDANNSVFANMRPRAELIVRMEQARAYDSAHQASLEEADEEISTPEDPLMKRADEYFDRRNHPFSRALEGKLAAVNGEWKVSKAEVAEWAKRLGKSEKGILWRTDGAFYVGGTYPAHFNDRGRQVPYRQSWQ